MSAGQFFIFMKKDKITERKTKLKIELYSNNKKIETINTNFLGPMGSSRQKNH